MYLEWFVDADASSDGGFGSVFFSGAWVAVVSTRSVVPCVLEHSRSQGLRDCRRDLPSRVVAD